MFSTLLLAHGVELVVGEFQALGFIESFDGATGLGGFFT